jgi:uncharacterized membrane protein
VSQPTTASVSVDVAASPSVIYGLVADVTNMGRWSPECRSCEWLDQPGLVGSRFRGRNRMGPLRWSTTARVLAAEPGEEFSFATVAGDRLSTQWTYRFEGHGDGTTLTESFDAIYTPPMIALVERLFMRNRQQQLEDGMRRTLEAIKAAAETTPV